MGKSVIVYLPEGFADWEGAFLLPELRETKRPVTVVSDSGSPVTSIGGLKTQVDRGISTISPEDVEALVLVGSDSWPEPDKNQRVLELAKDLHARGTLVAAICAATVALARIGMLDGKKHTSNDLALLKHLVPTYRGEKNFQNKLAVTDGNLITASGVGAIEFTVEVMTALSIHSPKKREQWYALYKHGTPPPPEFWNM